MTNTWQDGLPPDPRDMPGPIPLGLRNRNPGNLRFIADPRRAWNGQSPTPGQGGFGEYETLVLGVRAACKQLLKGFARAAADSDGKNTENTVRGIIHRWAPPVENSTDDYVEAVCRMTGYSPTGVLAPERATLYNLLRAIFKVEMGGHFVLAQTVRDGIEAALDE